MSAGPRYFTGAVEGLWFGLPVVNGLGMFPEVQTVQNSVKSTIFLEEQRGDLRL